MHNTIVRECSGVRLRPAFCQSRIESRVVRSAIPKHGRTHVVHQPTRSVTRSESFNVRRAVRVYSKVMDTDQAAQIQAHPSTGTGLRTSSVCAPILLASGPALAVAGDGSNPLEGILAGESPVPFIDGSVTGYWFLDVFVIMNLVLVSGLLLFTMFKPSSLKEESDAEIFSEEYNDNQSRR